jgi:antitoxin HicB
MTDDERQARIAELLERPYRKVIRGDRVEGYLAEAPDLAGCVTAGETEEQALANLREAMAAWLDSTLAGGGEVPEPRPEPGAQASGRMLVRMPPSLQAQLVVRAAQEGVSANQMAVTLLALGLGTGAKPHVADVEPGEVAGTRRKHAR